MVFMIGGCILHTIQPQVRLPRLWIWAVTFEAIGSQNRANLLTEADWLGASGPC